jgi:hypothetical protein
MLTRQQGWATSSGVWLFDFPLAALSLNALHHGLYARQALLTSPLFHDYCIYAGLDGILR